MRFTNPHAKEIKRTLFDVFLWKIGYYDDSPVGERAPKSFVYPKPQKKFDKSAPYAQWINHSTYLIHIDGMHLLTDPIWSDRCSPFNFLGPIRRHEPAIPLDRLPKIDCVLISHNHYDHLDKKTVKALVSSYPDITWCVPRGVKKWFEKQGITKVVECSWWDQRVLVLESHPHLRLKVTNVPAQHFSGRKMSDYNCTLWSGWVVDFKREGKAAKRLYFVGDTGYNPHDFKRIGEQFGTMDLSLIPIGSYSPRKFMAPVHIEPRDAVSIHQEVGSKLSLGMHWKTFHLSDEPQNQPPYDLYISMQEKGLDPNTFLAPEPGEQVNW